VHVLKLLPNLGDPEEDPAHADQPKWLVMPEDIE
jgi:hypothetical protein